MSALVARDADETRKGGEDGLGGTIQGTTATNCKANTARAPTMVMPMALICQAGHNMQKLQYHSWLPCRVPAPLPNLNNHQRSSTHLGWAWAAALRPPRAAAGAEASSSLSSAAWPVPGAGVPEGPCPSGRAWSRSDWPASPPLQNQGVWEVLSVQGSCQDDDHAEVRNMHCWVQTSD